MGENKLKALNDFLKGNKDFAVKDEDEADEDFDAFLKKLQEKRRQPLPGQIHSSESNQP